MGEYSVSTRFGCQKKSIINLFLLMLQNLDGSGRMALMVMVQVLLPLKLFQENLPF